MFLKLIAYTLLPVLLAPPAPHGDGAAVVPPASVAADPNASTDVVVVANKDDNTVTLIDVESGAALATLPVGVGPHEVAVSSDGRWAAVANYGDRANVGNTLTIIDLRQRAVARTVTLPDHRRPHGIAFLPGDRKLVVTAEADRALLVVDFETGAVAAALPTQGDLSHMTALTADGRRAYTANVRGGSVSELDLVTGTTRTLDVAPVVEAIAVSPDGREVWVGSNALNNIHVIDTGRWMVVDTIDSPGMPFRIAFTPDGQRAVVSAPMAGALRIFDVASRAEVGSVPLNVGGAASGESAGPVGLVIGSGGALGYVALQQTGEVAVVDLARAAVVRRIQVGHGPDGIAAGPRT